MGPLPEAILQLFTHHADVVAAKAKLRKDAVQLKAQVNDAVGGALLDIRDSLGVKMPEDVLEGDTNLRTLRTLLSMVDERGFERSPHQLQFHSAFERCVSRVIYKKDWSTSRPVIMKRNGWKKCSSEVMVSDLPTHIL